MELNYEIIKLSDKLPIRILLHEVKYVGMHWHDSIEILVVLKGSVSIVVQQEQYELQESDLIVIHSNELHALSSSEDNLVIALQVPTGYILQHFPAFNQYKLNCKSFLYDREHQDTFQEIRYLVAKIIWSYSKEGFAYELEIEYLLLQLLHELILHFREEENESALSDKHMDRLLRIINTIRDNYAEPITLKDIADQEFLSFHYLSKFFHKHMGMSFTKYVNSVRLEQSVKQLVSSDLPISDIALNHGFPNVKSYYKLFNEIYGVTPRQYRLQNTIHTGNMFQQHNHTVNYLEINRQNVFGELFQYLKMPATQPASKLAHSLKIHHAIDAAGKGKALKHNWRKMTSIGKAKEGLYAAVQSQLKTLQDEIGFQYIRFHGIFDDEMMVYSEEQSGKPVFSFAYVDQLFDFLLSIGLKPFIELGFTPSQLASGEQAIFYKKSCISKPKDYGVWKQMVYSLTNHLIDRYGLEEVRQWYFEVWNEPEFEQFWPDTFEDYCLLYKMSYDAIKEADAELKTGGPGTFSTTLLSNDWMDRFIAYCKAEACEPDFISFHSYPYENLDVDISQFVAFHDLLSAVPLSLNEDYLAAVIANVKRRVKSLTGMTEIHMTEWNSTAYQRDLINDTCYKAAYIIKNIVETMDEIDSYCYWTSTDLLEEFQISEGMFHGGLGLMSNNGMKKPAYYAYTFLSRLGNTLIARGKYYIVTRQNNSYQLILFNYCHYDKLYSQNDESGIDYSNRYDVFAENQSRELTISLDGLNEGDYTICKHVLNRQHGSVFDEWVSMGCPDRLSREELVYLQNISVPKRERKMLHINDSFQITAQLAPHEVQLYEIIPKR